MTNTEIKFENTIMWSLSLLPIDRSATISWKYFYKSELLHQNEKIEPL